MNDQTPKKEAEAAQAACCLDCSCCAPVAGVYGATSYRCVKTDREMGSSAALKESCRRFESARRRN